jgi:hypothetical protein
LFGQFEAFCTVISAAMSADREKEKPVVGDEDAKAPEDAKTPEETAKAPEVSDEEAAKAAKRKEIEAKVAAAQAARQKVADMAQAAEIKKKEIEEKGQGYYGNHPGITCDGCGCVPVFGYRYHCKQCANHDICESCYDSWMGGKGVLPNGLAKQSLSQSAADHHFYLFKDKGFKSLAKSNNAAEEKVAKVKPNDPCSCGSGKKYKKCCMKCSE